MATYIEQEFSKVHGMDGQKWGDGSQRLTSLGFPSMNLKLR